MTTLTSASSTFALLFPTWLLAVELVSPASLLDSQHGCIASPHAKKESGQTPYAVWSPLVQEFLGHLIVVGCGFYSSLLTVRPHLLTVQDQTTNGDSFFACGDVIHPCCESRRLAGETTVERGVKNTENPFRVLLTSDAGGLRCWKAY